ncbi:MAG: GTPase ObgE [Bacteroidia bacterium]
MHDQFVDYVKIYFASGAGGRGVVSWRREKYVPMGGPDGGDGGRGGHIILRGNAQLWTLLDLKFRKFVKAEPGDPGGANNRTGRNGQDQVLEVPLGTVVRDAETGEQLGEIVQDGEELILLEGGYGGRGNTYFKSPTNQAPEYAGPGGPARELQAILELKVLADVGLVGFPNAGKSTLLSVLSAARPKIADYAFTTLTPNLGIVRYRDHRSFVMADIPGIIENAHLGRGLGHHFLRHIERNSVLLFLVPVDSEDIRREYDILVRELQLYNPDLLDKPRLLALSKSDLIDAELEAEISQSLGDLPHLFFSALLQTGLQPLKDRLWTLLTS